MKPSWKMLVVVGGAVIVALVFATTALGAYARHASSPAGSGGGRWEIRLGSPAWSGSLKDLYPGAANDIEYIRFAVTSAGGGGQSVDSIRVSIRTASNGDAETASGVDIAGCLASWFTVSVDSHDDVLPADVAPGQSYVGRVDVTMRDGGTDQDTCRNASPAITVSVA